MTRKFFSIMVLFALVIMTNGQLCRSHCSSKDAAHEHHQKEQNQAIADCPHHMQEDDASHDGTHTSGEQTTIRCGCSDDHNAVAQETALTPHVAKPSGVEPFALAFQFNFKHFPSISVNPPEEPPRFS